MKRATISDAPTVLNINDRAMWVLGFNAALDVFAIGAPADRPPCTVCGKPWSEHGSYPTCASHPYTADGRCGAVGTLERGQFAGLPCPGSQCINGCVRATAPTPCPECHNANGHYEGCGRGFVPSGPGGGVKVVSAGRVAPELSAEDSQESPAGGSSASHPDGVNASSDAQPKGGA